jgi:hypothetical protein
MTNLKHGRWAGRLSAVLALLLAVGPGAPMAFANGNAAAGSVEVSSDPGGAAVYVDGQFEGTTPLRVESVTPGPHRVRVVKDGYLENRRVVDVQAGVSHDVRIPLTEHSGARFQVDPGSSGGGGGSKKGLLIGLGAVAVGAGLFLALRSTNDPPTCTGATASPGTGLAAATSVALSATCSDPDGDSLTYTWDFGDGASGSGASTSHVYARAGSFSATVTASDGEESATATASVTIRDLSGTWTGTLDSFFNTTLTFTQSGTTLSGSYSDNLGFTGPVTGSVSAPLGVTFTVSLPGFEPFTFSGSANGAITQLNGVANGSGFQNDPWNLSR